MEITVGKGKDSDPLTHIRGGVKRPDGGTGQSMGASQEEYRTHQGRPPQGRMESRTGRRQAPKNLGTTRKEKVRYLVPATLCG